MSQPSRRSRQLSRSSSAAQSKFPNSCTPWVLRSAPRTRNTALWMSKERSTDIRIPRSRQGDKLRITRSSDPVRVVAGCAPRANLHQMPSDLFDLVWIGDIGNHFTIPFGSSVYENRLYLSISENVPSAVGVQSAAAVHKSGSAP